MRDSGRDRDPAGCEVRKESSPRIAIGRKLLTEEPSCEAEDMTAAKPMETNPFKMAAVAIVNKLARIAFARMRDGSIYGNAVA
jgi:hypothetical protein